MFSSSKSELRKVSYTDGEALSNHVDPNILLRPQQRWKMKSLFTHVGCTSFYKRLYHKINNFMDRKQSPSSGFTDPTLALNPNWAMREEWQ